MVFGQDFAQSVQLHSYVTLDPYFDRWCADKEACASFINESICVFQVCFTSWAPSWTLARILRFTSSTSKLPARQARSRRSRGFAERATATTLSVLRTFSRYSFSSWHVFSFSCSTLGNNTVVSRSIFSGPSLFIGGFVSMGRFQLICLPWLKC